MFLMENLYGLYDEQDYDTQNGENCPCHSLPASLFLEQKIIDR